MPLINGKPFKNKRLTGVSDEDEVFVNVFTNEAFTDFDAFSWQAWQCSVTEWTCSFCGKDGLTYNEAIECEKEATKMLSIVQPEFGVPIVYLASRTATYSLDKMVLSVYNYVKDRYFLGEIVEVNYEGTWQMGHVLEVLMILNNVVKASDTSGEQYAADAFCYSVELTDFEDVRLVVPGNRLRRSSEPLREDIVHKFLSIFVEKSKDGTWRVRENILQQYGIPHFVFANAFWGHPPSFPPDLPKKKSSVGKKNVVKGNSLGNEKRVQVTLDRYFGVSPTSNLNEELEIASKGKTNVRKKSPNVGQTKKIANTFKKSTKMDKGKKGQQDVKNKKHGVGNQEQKKVLGQKQKLQDQNKTDKAGQKEEKAGKRKDAQRLREDLECKDVKLLPAFNEIQCQIPGDHFGEFMIVLEFFHSFRRLIPSMSKFFPSNGITFEILERALATRETNGPFCDILQLLLCTIFELQDEEGDDDDTSEADAVSPRDDETEKAMKFATSTKYRSRLSYGMPIKNLHLDAISISEILRLHLLTSGARLERDDPGLVFCVKEARMMNHLEHKSVQELSMGDKLKILTCLIDQILVYSKFREYIDDKAEKFRQEKVELRLMLSELKKKKEPKATKEKEGATPADPPVVLSEEILKAQQLQIEKEIIHKQREAEKKAKKLAALALSFQILPLGRDRDYRRYWMFTSLPGLFLEHCTDDDFSQHEESSTSSDKENDERGLHSPGKKNSGIATVPDEVTSVEPVLQPNVLAWYFCGKEDDFNSLLKCLNTRGIREHHLHQILEKEKDRIVESIQACPITKLNPALEEDPDVQELRKSGRRNSAYNKQWNNLGYPPEMPLPDIWCELLRNEILDIEDHLFRGGLGNLHVEDRVKWAEAILNNGYDKQCSTLVWGKKTLQREDDDDDDDDDVSNELPECVQSPCSFIELEKSDPAISKMLACAVLQVGQGVYQKFLKEPLADKKQMVRWESSLMKCTNLSQVYLHLNVLNASVTWSKSVLKANCRLCRRGADPEKMLLCDKCNKGYHMYCLKPKMTKIPDGDWFGPCCEPKDSAVGKRRSASAADRNAKRTKTEDVCSGCGLPGEFSSCAGCLKPLHSDCGINLMENRTKTIYCKFCAETRKKRIEERSKLGLRKVSW